MSLSEKAKDLIRIAMPLLDEANELIAEIDKIAASGAVSALGTTADLTALVPGATSHTAVVPVAASFTASNCAGAADPTATEVDTEIDELAAEVVTALGLKADNDDVETLRGEIQTAMDLKSDNADVETLRTEVEDRLDDIEAKVDELIAALS